MHHVPQQLHLARSCQAGHLELRPNRTAAEYPTAYKPVNLLRAGQGLVSTACAQRVGGMHDACM